MFKYIFTFLFVLIWCTSVIAQDVTRISASETYNNTETPFKPNAADTVLRWDDGVNFGAVGLSAGGDMEVAARFDGSIMTPLIGHDLTQIEAYLGTFTGALVLNVYGQGTDTTAGPLLYSEDVTVSVTFDDWNLFTLATPVPITGGDIWVGYIVTHIAGEFPAGRDAGPHVPDGDWVNLGGWASLFDLTAGAIDGNWNIAAYVEEVALILPLTDDFEAYTVGGQLACQNPSQWSTWTPAPCTSEDVDVSSDYAFSGTNSVVIAPNNDLIKPLGTQTTGKWDIGFMMYIPTGKLGYFNTLAVSPHTGTTTWGMQVYFDTSGSAYMHAGASNSSTWTYTYDAWHQCRVIVDLDTDWAEFYFDSVLVQEWQWTLGTFGAGAPLQLDANNWYGATADDSMYVDDYQVGQYPYVPVELTSFTANVNHSGQVVLNWSTATETNSQLFEIERRTAEGQFATIGYVEGHGTTTEPQNYSYTDVTVSTGIYFYRLKQLDFLGTYEYFDEIEVDVTGPLTFDLEQNYPNPFNPSTNIKYSVPVSGDVRLAVYNLIGEEVAVLVDGFSEAGFYEVTFDASLLSSGAYFYKLQSGNSFVVKKMLLLK